MAMEVEDVDPDVSALCRLAEKGDSTAFLQCLVRVGAAKLNRTNADGDTPLHLACLYGSHDVVNMCLSRGALVNARDEENGTPLHDASASGFLEIAKELVEAKADVDAMDGDLDTPLHHACRGNHLDVALLLVGRDARTDVRNSAREDPASLFADDELRATFVSTCEEAIAQRTSSRRIARAVRPRPVGTDGRCEAPPAPEQARGLGGSGPVTNGPQEPLPLPDGVLQELLQEPEFMQALVNPGLLARMRAVLENPSSLDATQMEDAVLARFVEWCRAKLHDSH